jgi:hypothetical protein
VVRIFAKTIEVRRNKGSLDEKSDLMNDTYSKVSTMLERRDNYIED